jgi:hypothetical protein
LEVRKDKKGSPATVYQCHGSGGNQYWEYYKGVLKRDAFYLTDELVFKSFKRIPKEKVSEVCQPFIEQSSIAIDFSFGPTTSRACSSTRRRNRRAQNAPNA